MSASSGPKQNVVSLQDGRALVGTALDGASPCLTSYSFAKGLGDAERERLSVLLNPKGSGKELRRARNDGHVMPVRFHDRPAGLTALVLLGDQAPDVEAAWVGRAAWRLNVPCGWLGVSAGWHLLERPDGHLDWSGDPYFKYVAVPPGAYLVEFLAFFPADEALFGARGAAARFDVPGRPQGVPVGEYFRRTRPNEPLPDWLVAYLRDCPAHDPGHEEEWQEAEDDEVEVEDYLFHAIRLTPVKKGDLPPRRPRDLWIPFALRTPPKCPSALPLPGEPQ